ncbi:phosphoesterase RecJ domain-containing protein [Desulfuromusa kysingii]|uniref:Phosphoesterase RecJ domain-containing protein n=1 Tax=Desulfuromusa kysingii TaxID=37625 RepID=A0A1H4D0W7_9BACT|nr:DHH family phosphoesterase [Desulfuromusa kysingii]SEA66413.1 phosphoesterase RecJ domain-containing protein [Desulfuromusa kysingii]
MIIQQIIEIINTNQTFLVVAHENPDGDAIGSTLGLALALRDMGKEVVAYNVNSVPAVMRFLPESDFISNSLPENAGFDVAFVLDAGDLERTTLPVKDLCQTLINIDHHPDSTFGDPCYLDTTACATAVLIYRLLSACQYPMSLPVAKALYLGILSDTGSFRYSSANQEAFLVAGELVGLGVDPWEVSSNLYESHAPERMKLLGMVLPTLHIAASGRYASVVLTLDALKKSGALEEHADGFVNYPRSISGVEVALFFNQISSDLYKISFRSRGNIDVGSLAHKLGGGGHHNAAGAKLSGSLDEVKTSVFTLLDQLLS